MGAVILAVVRVIVKMVQRDDKLILMMPKNRAKFNLGMMDYFFKSALLMNDNCLNVCLANMTNIN